MYQTYINNAFSVLFSLYMPSPSTIYGLFVYTGLASFSWDKKVLRPYRKGFSDPGQIRTKYVLFSPIIALSPVLVLSPPHCTYVGPNSTNHDCISLVLKFSDRSDP